MECMKQFETSNGKQFLMTLKLKKNVAFATFAHHFYMFVKFSAFFCITRSGLFLFFRNIVCCHGQSIMSRNGQHLEEN